VAPKPLALVLVLGMALGARGAEPTQEPAAAPPAPPLPFRYVGRVVQNGKAEVLLLRGVMLHTIAEGDEIDGEYRVERITGAAIQFTYLPAGSRQQLDLSAGPR
jgi:hypothetical protein